MNAGEIKRLLERYYNAETSEEEEIELRNFFNQKDVPVDLGDEREIFNYYDQLSGVQEPSADFEKRIMESIGHEVLKDGRSGYRKILFTYAGIAAGLVILAGTYFFFARESEPTDTFSDPEIAYAETMKILHDVSIRLNNGTRALKTVGMMQEVAQKSINEISKPINLIEEKLKPLDQLDKAMGVVGGMSDEK